MAGRAQALLGSTLMSNATDVPGTRPRADGVRRRRQDRGGRARRARPPAGARPAAVVRRRTAGRRRPRRPSCRSTPADLPAHATAPTILEHHEERAAGPDLGAAKVVIAGGRGLGGPDAFAMLDELAGAIGGAAVGASRAAVDAGWVPYRYQIGQTGITVTPEVYLAFGISGALQHVVGMKKAKRIVAVNRDADAPIMAMADVAVVGDLFQIVPALTQEIQRRGSA